MSSENVLRHKWQQYWDSGDTGRSIYNILPKVSRTQASWSGESILFAMDHGPFPSYLYRFRLHYSNICACGEKGDPLHYQLLVLLRHLLILPNHVQNINFGLKTYF
ncbi:hypothetical protein AVEN_161664-1 [Araneus ventricosus]|uniref:Uncharacterized protein n=1 Tax=Araneus ventricosus TaxID=182803 RepID=A0A4Y2N8W0_ARAVE|nr:hypothetical protein AVEN_161664-1 [Araneus ventricosus]